MCKYSFVLSTTSQKQKQKKLIHLNVGISNSPFPFFWRQLEDLEIANWMKAEREPEVSFL